MKLSDHDLRQIDEERINKLSETAVKNLSISLLNDLKEARERLNQNSKNCSIPPSSEAPWDKASKYEDEEEDAQSLDDIEALDKAMGCNGAGAKGLPYLAWNDKTTGNRRILLNPAKSFPITKHQVWEAYKRVKANHGGAGIDAQTLEKFDQDLGNNLYKLWNRMASGSYQPPPVKRVSTFRKPMAEPVLWAFQR
jgi:hypothetical protein